MRPAFRLFKCFGNVSMNGGKRTSRCLVENLPLLLGRYYNLSYHLLETLASSRACVFMPALCSSIGKSAILRIKKSRFWAMSCRRLVFPRIERKSRLLCNFLVPKRLRNCEVSSGFAPICKDSVFQWSSNCAEAFSLLRDMLSLSPVLRHFNPNAPVELHRDTSGDGLHAVLVQ